MIKQKKSPRLRIPSLELLTSILIWSGNGLLSRSTRDRCTWYMHGTSCTESEFRYAHRKVRRVGKKPVFVPLHTDAAVISSFNFYSGKDPKSRSIVAGPDSIMSPSWFRCSCDMKQLCYQLYHITLQCPAGQLNPHPCNCDWKKSQFAEKSEGTPHLIRLLPGSWLMLNQETQVGLTQLLASR